MANKNDKKPTLADITPELIKEWKGKYDAVFAYTAKDGKKAYFRNPEIPEIEASSAVANQGHPIKSNRVLAEACFLGGDEEVFSNKNHLMGLGKKLTALVVTIEGELEEL